MLIDREPAVSATLIDNIITMTGNWAITGEEDTAAFAMVVTFLGILRLSVGMNNRIVAQ